MAYTLSKIFVGGIAGSVAAFARGASQKKCASSANIGLPVFLALSTIACTAGESGFGGAAAGAWARLRKGSAMESTKMDAKTRRFIGPPAARTIARRRGRYFPSVGMWRRPAHHLDAETSSAGANCLAKC